MNFDKEMLIVVLFNFEPTYVEDKKHISYVLHSVEKHNNVLNVNIRYKCLDNQENFIIEQESLVIKMNKTNFKYVKYFGECIKY